MKFIIKFSSIFQLIAACFLLAAGPTQAGQLGLSLAPPILKAQIQPGKSATSTFILKNTSSLGKTFTLRLVPFVPSDTGQPVLQPGMKAEWLRYFKIKNSDLSFGEPFVLTPNQNKEIILTIDIPARASQSDYYVTLLASMTEPKERSSSAFSASIGSNILVTVSPINHPPTLIRITEFDLAPKSYLFRWSDYYIADSLTPIIFEATAKNLGKYLIQTTGTLSVGTPNKSIGRIELAPLNLLSNSSRKLATSPSGELTFKPKITNLGLYTAALDLKNENGSSHSEVTLVILPIKYLLALIVITLIAITAREIMKKSQIKPIAPSRPS